MGDEAVKGYMIVNVEEAKPKNKQGEVMWDGEEFEAFVKGERNKPPCLACIPLIPSYSSLCFHLPQG